MKLIGFFCVVLELFSMCASQVTYIIDDVVIKEGNVVSTDNTNANAGNFRGVRDIERDTIQNNLALNNSASSNSGLANAGDRTFFAGANSHGLVGNNFESRNTAANNVASSKTNSAISGSQLVVGSVNSSTFQENSVTRNNRALVFGRRSEYYPYAIAGSETQIYNVIRASRINLTNSAQGNVAVNGLQGSALSGVRRTFGNINGAKVQLESSSTQNEARTEYGQAVSGTVNSIGRVINSNVQSTSEASDNYAKSSGGDAVAGIQNNVQLIRGTFSFDPEDQPTFTANDTASNNIAIAQSYGKPISGIQSNIRDVINGSVVLNATSVENLAIADGYAEEEPKDAVAGIDITVGRIKDSQVELNLESHNNNAKNYHYDPYYKSDAVAGVQLTIGTTDKVVLNTNIRSTNNSAYALYGYAIGGNKIRIYDMDGRLNGEILEIAENNTAESVYGDAIVISRIDVGPYRLRGI